MMKKLLTVLILGFIGAISGTTIAQNFVFDGEIRPRFENRNGYKTLGVDGVQAASFISQRSRLNFKVTNEKYIVGISLQDVRVWGDVGQLNTMDAFGPSIHQAWGQVWLHKKVALKAGRQEIIYDDHRIFGSVGWAQQARSHDAAIFKIKPNGNMKFDVGFAYNQDQERLFGNVYNADTAGGFAAKNNYKALQFLHYHQDMGKLGLSILVLNNGVQFKEMNSGGTFDFSTIYSQTAGARITYKSGKLKANAAAYLQTGKNAKNKDLSANYFAADASYKVAKTLSAGVGFEYLSGTSTTNQADANAKDNSFTPFYGTNHKFNGWMDYFYVGSSHKNSGLLDIYVPIVYKKGKFSAKLIPHMFQATADIADSNDPTFLLDANLGTEVDVTLAYKLNPNVALSCGYSQMFATTTLEQLKGVANPGNTQSWGWVMLTFKPTFISK